MTNIIKTLTVAAAFTFLSATASTASAKSDTTPAKITEEGFLYEKADFPSCHASTVLETQKGSTLVAYFGGEYEGADDVKIWISRREKGKKTWQMSMAADGFGTACYNPVLTELPDGRIVLFYKIGKNVQAWTGWYKISTDDGHTWGEPVALPHGFLGPIKDKPIVTDNRLLCPSSKEKDYWRVHFETWDLATGKWHYTGPFTTENATTTMDRPKEVLQPIVCIQPTVIRLPDGTLQALCRTKNGFLATTYSADNGLSWTPIVATDLPNNNSGVDAVTLSDGRHALVYNDLVTPDGGDMGPRNSLALAIFSPDMSRMEQKISLENTKEGEYSYPAIIETKDGRLFITYTWHRKRIAYKVVKP